MPTTVIYITAGMLFLGAAPLPYGYYMLLRLVVTIVFAWAAYATYERKEEVLPWVLGVIALLFNPLIPIHLPKEVWMIVDVGAGIFLLTIKKQIQVR